VFGNRLAYVNRIRKRYDIIIFRYPDDESQLFIKRVIGLPGDTIDIRDGEVYVNGSGTPLTDSFCPEQGVTDAGESGRSVYGAGGTAILFWGTTA
jgi:signal peptidase I